MNKDATVADAIYKGTNPKILEEWKDCNRTPEYLVKHLAAVDTLTAVCLIELKRSAVLIETNAVEETVYGIVGYPKCWEGDKTRYFLKKINS